MAHVNIDGQLVYVPEEHSMSRRPVLPVRESITRRADARAAEESLMAARQEAVIELLANARAGEMAVAILKAEAARTPTERNAARLHDLARHATHDQLQTAAVQAAARLGVSVEEAFAVAGRITKR